MSSKRIQNIGLSLFEFSMILIIATSIVRLASSLYLPSLLDIGVFLDMSEHELAMTLSVFFVAYAISTIFVGPLVDYYGRKELILIGSVIFIFGSILCGVAESSSMLFGGRILQAIGASAIPVASRAIIREYCSDIDVIKVLGWLAGIGGLVPILAPAIGGIITDTFGWRYNFYILVIFSFLALIYAYIKLPKSIQNNSNINLLYIVKSYIEIISSPNFSVVIAPLALAFSIQGIFLVSTPFIFMKSYELSAFEYGLTNIIIASGLLFGRYIALFLIQKFTIYFAYVSGAILTFVGGAIMLFFLNIGNLNMIIFLICIFISVSGFGTLLPIGIKSIMSIFKNKSGMVSALHGFITLAFMAGGSYIFSYMRDNFDISYILTLSLAIVIFSVPMCLVSFSTKKYLQ
jgi:DHA1 family bicyclomycin/chloramphenicol resistance-like MFS transporter